MMIKCIPLKTIRAVGKRPKTVLKHPRLFKFLIKSEIRKTPELLALFTNTISLTQIHNNNQTINNIPQNVKAYLDCRLLVGQDENF